MVALHPIASLDMQGGLTPNPSLNPDTSPAALARRPLAAG